MTGIIDVLYLTSLFPTFKRRLPSRSFKDDTGGTTSKTFSQRVFFYFGFPDLSSDKFFVQRNPFTFLWVPSPKPLGVIVRTIDSVTCDRGGMTTNCTIL